MESSLAVELFNEEPQREMRYSTYVSNEDCATESRMKVLIEHQLMSIMQSLLFSGRR